MQRHCAKCDTKIGCFILLYFVKCGSIGCFLKKHLFFGCKISDKVSHDMLCSKHLYEFDEKDAMYTAYLKHQELLEQNPDILKPVFLPSTTVEYCENEFIPITYITEMSDELKTILLTSGYVHGHYNVATGKFVVKSKKRNRINKILHGISPILQNWERIRFK